MRNDYLLWFTNVYNGYVRSYFLEKWDEKKFNDTLSTIVKILEESEHK